MWKEYSVSYIKNNKATSISIMVAALISAMFLSLITSVFYNIWMDDIRQIIKKEGDWQAKFTGSVSEEENTFIQSFANVKDVKRVETEHGEETFVYFYNKRTIYQDISAIAKRIEKETSEVLYHDVLLSEYFIFSPDKEHPPMLLAFYVLVMAVACSALILIIRNAFLVSLHSRLHQLGILQSIGATPRQIRGCLLQEALVLCLLPIFLGIGGGVVLCMVVIEFANGIAGRYRGEHVVFMYHVGLFLVTLLASVGTVLYSAWLPARRLRKMSPLQIIKGKEDGKPFQTMKHFRLISLFFGIEGELARKSLYVRRESLRSATWSLTLSFFSFSMFLCFITLSGISTKYTYFERYKNAWDIMVTVKDQSIIEVENVMDFSVRTQVASCKIYQKATLETYLTKDMLGDALQGLGGIGAVAGSDVVAKEHQYQVKVPIVVLDDISFQDYCEDLGIEHCENRMGMVTINRIWDSQNSNFRYKKYIPYIKEQEGMVLSLYQKTEEGYEAVKVPIIAFTDKLPVLREEYSNYALVQVMSSSTWQGLLATMNIDAMDTYINIQTKKEEDIPITQTKVEQLLQGKSYIIENRVDKEWMNQEIKAGYTLIVGGLCGLLAIIGLANVFSNTLGYIYQRKREFARYLSIGLSPKGMRKILCKEALIVGGRPIVYTIPLTIIFVVFATRASYINPMEFLQHVPIIPFTIFAGMIFGCIALAHYIGARKLSMNTVMEILNDDTLL